MKRTCIALAFALIASTASAKDITLPLDDEQQKALIQLLDLAVKSGGLAVAQNAAFFYQQIQSAQLNADKPPAEAPTPKP